MKPRISTEPLIFRRSAPRGLPASEPLMKSVNGTSRATPAFDLTLPKVTVSSDQSLSVIISLYELKIKMSRADDVPALLHYDEEDTVPAPKIYGLQTYA